MLELLTIFKLARNLLTRKPKSDQLVDTNQSINLNQEKSMKLVKIFASAILALSVSSLHAAPIVTLGNLGDLHTTVVGAAEYTFDTLACPYVSCAGDYQIRTTSVDGQSAKPLNSVTNYLSVPNPIQNGSATFSLGFVSNYFGLYWGSVDAYNTIAFYDGLNHIATYTGTDLLGAFANGDQVNTSSNRFINFQFMAGELFNKIVLSSNGYAFESDNHAFATVNTSRVSDVPEPATVLLMLLGLAGISSVRRRRV